MKGYWKKSIRPFFRIGFFVVLLVLLYSHGAPLPLLAVLAAFFCALLFVRNKLWNGLEKKLKDAPFMKGRPEWQRWLLVMALFLAAYFVIRYALFSVLRFLGFDAQGELSKALGLGG